MVKSTQSATRLEAFIPQPEGSDRPDILRVIAVGSPQVVNHHVMQMYQKDYAQPHEWSRSLPTTNPGEVMRILTKRFMELSQPQ